MKKSFVIQLAYITIFCGMTHVANAQMITGVWKGKISKQKVELKIIQNRDSLEGSSYYYESATNYRHYSIKGYFDATTNETVWWDDQLIEEKSGKFSITTPGRIPMLSRADFNCPGGSKMMLDGKAAKRDDDAIAKGDVHLDKSSNPLFGDEWDFVINNYTDGANDPDIINSIALIAQNRETPSKSVGEGNTPKSPDVEKAINNPVIKIESSKKEPIKEEQKRIVKTIEPVTPLTIEEKFVSRKKTLTLEIPVTGDSIELRFYDNAEVDGDSISLFLNEQLIFQHIRLLGSAYTIKLAVSELKETNELIMVAENLGAIPPNTSYMVAIVGDKRYEARLESTEGSSAMVKFIKK